MDTAATIVVLGGRVRVELHKEEKRNGRIWGRVRWTEGPDKPENLKDRCRQSFPVPTTCSQLTNAEA